MQRTTPLQLVEEVPLAISVNGINFAVMLASPNDLEDFTVGYLFSESVIQANHDIHDIELTRQEDAVLVDVTVANRCIQQLKNQQRNLKGTSGCGLCGTQALAIAFPKLHPIATRLPLDRKKLTGLKEHLRSWQTLGKQSGALHAAFWLNENTDIEFCREDIGRHNALDKVLGCLLRQNVNRAKGSVLVTSRCSVELVQKTIKAGVSNLISLASPSTLAVKMARQHRLNLVHIPKQDAPYFLAGENHA